MNAAQRSQDTATTPGPLSGMRVIELTIWVQGPLAGTMLADLGAEVIKIERAGSADPLRNMATTYGKNGGDAPRANATWTACNRNKRAIALDLYKPEAQQVFHRLVDDADIFLTNLQPPALARFGADELTVRTRNPRIIYARGGGLGDRGPRAPEPCQDTVGMAYSGFMYTCASSADKPYYPPGALSDVLAGTMLGAGVLAAVAQRNATGEGCVVTTSQLQSMMWLQSLVIAPAASLGQPPSVTSHDSPPNPVFNTYLTGDGAWIALGLPVASQWPVFLEAVGLDHLDRDPRFAGAEQRAVNSAALVQIIETHFASAPAAHWLERMRAKGLWVGPVHRVDDLIGDEQVEANGYLMELDDGFRTPTMPFTVAGCRPATLSAPAYGADTDAVLGEAGFSADEITTLRIGGSAW